MTEKSSHFLRDEDDDEVTYDLELKHMELRGWNVRYDEMALQSEVEVKDCPKGVRIEVAIELNPLAKVFTCTFFVERKHRFTPKGKGFLDILQNESRGKVPTVEIKSTRIFIFRWNTKAKDFFDNPSSRKLEEHVGELVRIGGRFAYLSSERLTYFEKKRGQYAYLYPANPETYKKAALLCLLGFKNERNAVV